MAEFSEPKFASHQLDGCVRIWMTIICGRVVYNILYDNNMISTRQSINTSKFHSNKSITYASRHGVSLMHASSEQCGGKILAMMSVVSEK